MTQCQPDRRFAAIQEAVLDLAAGALEGRLMPIVQPGHLRDGVVGHRRTKSKLRVRKGHILQCEFLRERVVDPSRLPLRTSTVSSPSF
jgi:hypothetical protein